MSTRPYSPGEQPDYGHSNFFGPNKFNRYFYLRLGEILEVDPDNFQILIKWITGKGSPEWLPFSYPYLGPAGCIGMYPERYSYAIFGYMDVGTGKGSPLLLAYVPRSLTVSLNYNDLKLNPDAVENEDQNQIPFRFRKLSEGDGIFQAPAGASLLVNSSAEITDSMMDSFLVRSSDQAIISTSLNNFLFADGVSVRAGNIIRNLMNTSEGNGVPVTLPNGKENIYLVPYGEPIEYDTRYYTEYRIDVDELGDGMLDSNDINNQNAISNRDPIVAFSLGNFVGNNSGDSDYGLILRPSLFKNSDDTEGQFQLIQCVQNKGQDEVITIGMAHAMHFPKAGSFLGVDKEGHYYVNLGASKANPLGGGRSMSLLAQGNLKEIWGAATDDQNSWDLATKGGIHWLVGNHNELRKGRSIEIVTSSGAYFEYGGADNDDYAKQESSFGNVQEYVGGHKREQYEELSQTVNGLREESVFGSATENYQNDLSVTVKGISTEIAVTEKQCKFGKRNTTITDGDDELTIVKGDLTQTLTLGSKNTFLTAGDISETIVAGDRKTTLTAGDHKVTVVAGDISATTAAGNISMSAPTGNFTVTAPVGEISLKSTTVKLGIGPVYSPVVTGAGGLPSHFDYTTGAPLKGTSTVSAGI